MTMVFEDFISSLRGELSKVGNPRPHDGVYFQVEFEYETRRGEYSQKIDVRDLGKDGGLSIWYKTPENTNRNQEWFYGVNWEIIGVVRGSRLLRDPFLVVRVRRSR